MIKNTGHGRNSKSKASRNACRRTETENACRICKKVFSSRGNLVQHMDTHVGVDKQGNPDPLNTFDCRVCGKSFLQKRYLLSHQTRCSVKKKATKKLHHCGLCGKIFARLSHLRRHEAHHLKQNTFICTICERRFVQQHHLERHFRSEAHQQKEIQLQQNSGTDSAPAVKVNAFPNIRRHKCPFCSKAFSTAWEMQRHWRTIHPYAIRRTVSSGSNHELARTTFLLKCSRCGLRFDNDLLHQNHLEWHQGKRPYKCEKCGLAFFRRLELDNHRAAKHGIGWIFECAECGGKFAQRTEMDRHINAKHLVVDAMQPISIDRRRRPLINRKYGRGAMLHCKYCGDKTDSVADYRDHIAHRHFRKVFVEEAPVIQSPDQLQTDEPSRNAASSSDQDIVDQNSNIKLVVTVCPTSQPVRTLRLGSKLPQWLLKLQPSYSMLDVALDEDGQALGPGESIVLQLPVSPNIPSGSIMSKTIRVSYSV